MILLWTILALEKKREVGRKDISEIVREKKWQRKVAHKRGAKRTSDG